MKDIRSVIVWPVLWCVLILFAGLLGGCQAQTPNWAEAHLSTVPEERQVIAVPLDRLRAGDLRYNIVIQPGDELLVVTAREKEQLMARRIYDTGQEDVPPPTRIISDERRWADLPYAAPISVDDIITVTVYELIEPGVDHIQTLRVDGDGLIHVDVLGQIQAEGRNRHELEQEMRRLLEEKMILRNATISVIPQTLHAHRFTLISEGGRHEICLPKPNMRLLESLVLAGIKPESNAPLAYIIRR